MDRSSVIFGNKMSRRTARKAEGARRSFIRRFGDDRGTGIHLAAADNSVLTPAFGARTLVLSDSPLEALPPKCIVIGNIRMGFGHYRISMAMASAAHYMGYTPLWFDLNSFGGTTCTKIISYQNSLYSAGSRLSQKCRLFDALVWEPLNSEGFRKLSYNASDQAVTELMTDVFDDIPRDVPFIATHVWPAQAAVHAGMRSVVNAVPDNWPMALHLAEGALHTVQTPSAYSGYRTLRGMDGDTVLRPMSGSDIMYTGHYIDHEIVAGIEDDCSARVERIRSGMPMRFLLTVGGAGAQGEFFAEVVRTLLPYVRNGRASVYVNVGDYLDVWRTMKKEIPGLDGLCGAGMCTEHIGDWQETRDFALRGGDEGMHVFCNSDIFAAVYTTNVLMRISSVLVTKPGELAFYPVPKLHIRRVGGHEAWGAIRSAEVGDGTPECTTPASAGAMAVRMIEEPDIVENMCGFIRKAKDEGIYNGAYRAVEAAVNGGRR